MYHSLFVHSFFDGHLGCFHVLAIVNSAVMNIGVHVIFFFSYGFLRVYMPNSGIAGSYGSFIHSLFFFKGISIPLKVLNKGIG